MKRRALAFAAIVLLSAGMVSPVIADQAPLAATEALKRVRDVVAMQLGVDPKRVEPAKRLTELGMDELDLVELIMALEEEFDIAIPDEAIDSNGPRGWDDAVTTQRLVEIVQDLTRKKRK